MRTFHFVRALTLIILFLVAGFTGFATPGAFAAQPGNTPRGNDALPTVSPPAPNENPLRGLAIMRSKLDQQDHLIALRALHLALSQVPDGGTFVWRKRSRSLKGMIKPTKAFRNTDGQVCRHVIYALALGRYLKQIEGIACRQDDGHWQL